MREVFKFYLDFAVHSASEKRRYGGDGMSTTIKFSSHGSTISAEVFSRASGDTGGTVVIAYGSDGMTDDLNGPWASMIRGYGERLSSQGHTAIVPDYFARTGTEPGRSALQLIPVHLDEWQATILDAIPFAATLPGVDPSRIGLLGFSLGGHLCLKNRDHGKVLVEFFAPELAGVGSIASGPKNAQVHHGLADQVVPLRTLRAFRRFWKVKASPRICPPMRRQGMAS